MIQDELQEMAKRRNEVLEDSEREETSWLARLGRYDYKVERSRSGSPSHDSLNRPTAGKGEHKD
jgi:hypothetical protein